MAVYPMLDDNPTFNSITIGKHVIAATGSSIVIDKPLTVSSLTVHDTMTAKSIIAPTITASSNFAVGQAMPSNASDTVGGSWLAGPVSMADQLHTGSLSVTGSAMVNGDINIMGKDNNLVFWGGLVSSPQWKISAYTSGATANTIYIEPVDGNITDSTWSVIASNNDTTPSAVRAVSLPSKVLTTNSA